MRLLAQTFNHESDFGHENLVDYIDPEEVPPKLLAYTVHNKIIEEDGIKTLFWNGGDWSMVKEGYLLTLQNG